VLAVAACDNSALTNGLEPAGLKPEAAAVVSRSELKIPVSGAYFDECNGELAFLEGVLSIEIHSTVSSSGVFNYKYQYKLTGRGTGVTTGRKYDYQGLENYSFHGGPGTTWNDHFRIRVVAQGSADNLDAVLHLKLTINANGAITAEIETIKIECRG
jgi:hypothetical protein